MKYILIGFLLIFLDFNINLTSSTLELIPDFIGDIVMVNGLTEMARENYQFIKVKPYAIGMAVYTGILYFLDFAGITGSFGVFGYILVIATIVVSLYISYGIVMGVQEMELKYHTFLNGENLKSMWYFLAACSASAFFAMVIPTLAAVFLILGLIAAISFLVAFNKSKNLYYEIYR